MRPMLPFPTALVVRLARLRKLLNLGSFSARPSHMVFCCGFTPHESSSARRIGRSPANFTPPPSRRTPLSLPYLLEAQQCTQTALSTFQMDGCTIDRCTDHRSVHSVHHFYLSRAHLSKPSCHPKLEHMRVGTLYLSNIASHVPCLHVPYMF